MFHFPTKNMGSHFLDFCDIQKWPNPKFSIPSHVTMHCFQVCVVRTNRGPPDRWFIRGLFLLLGKITFRTFCWTCWITYGGEKKTLKVSSTNNFSKWTLWVAILGVGFPLHKPYPYSLYIWAFLHFWYLKRLGKKVQKSSPRYIWASRRVTKCMVYRH